MTKIPYGSPGDIPPVEVKCKADEFENYIREFGVVNACEWFLEHYPDLHTCRITYIGSQCRLVLTDSEKREFMHYLFSGSKVNIHEDDYKMYVNYDIQRGIYDDAHYIIDVPHVSSKNKPPQKTEE